MKHLLNNLSEEEKNSIREQHTGGMKVVNERFNEMVNKVLGDAKPYLSEQQDMVLGDKTDQPTEGGEKDEQPVKKKYLPISDEFCDVRLGNAQVKKGAKGELVKLFQEALNNCGGELSKQEMLVVDGNFGDLTKNAVIDFQEKNGLKVDGGIGQETSGKLCELGCISKEICDKCKNGGEENGLVFGDKLKEGTVNVNCEKVQACISDFMKGLQDDFCVDEDKVRGLLRCAGLGNCFEEGLKEKIDTLYNISKKTIDV